MIVESDMVREVIRYHLLESLGTFEVSDLIGNLADPEESDEYDDSEWEELAERVADEVHCQLRSAWDNLKESL
ncbi:hypothetical protein [Mycobacteroides abscessus]|uniref:hypothetical protein n=1 Tax=Mycobacteroides abscessus TaxID=36809 RepID=UPI000927B4F1|nr:hypothetical protein [Mycobacteroides abscessus]SIL62827.1 Uncharacterised protein [Mycobacteroides abscessus subsp. abscessus]